MARLWWVEVCDGSGRPVNFLDTDDVGYDLPVRRLGWLVTKHSGYEYFHSGLGIGRLDIDCDSIEHAKVVVETAVRLRCNLEISHE